MSRGLKETKEAARKIFEELLAIWYSKVGKGKKDRSENRQCRTLIKGVGLFWFWFLAKPFRKPLKDFKEE